MPKRRLRVVNADSPLFCVCEACSASFKSSSQQSDQAEREVKAQFDAHQCKPLEPQALRAKCAICSNPILLEEAKVSADGEPIHEECYVAKLTLSKHDLRQPLSSVTRMPIMAKRVLRIVKREPGLTVGVCEACNNQFRSHIQPTAQAEWEITVLFQRHKCKPLR